MSTAARILENKGNRVVRVDDDATAFEAAKLMRDHRIGSVVVTRDEKVVGIFTERDMLNRVVAEGLNPSELKVRQVMTAPIACCSETTSLTECRSIMKSRRLRHLPVVKNDRLIGIVSIGDIIEDEGAEKQAVIKSLYEYMTFEWKNAD